ncbi:MAG: hypothetical protein ACI37U_03575 [Bacteroides sp.]
MKKNERSKKRQNREDEILEASWDLNSRLGSIISSRLQTFKEASTLSGATPWPFSFKQVDGQMVRTDDGWERWAEVLDKMIWSFNEYAHLDECLEELPEEYQKRLQEGLDLFAKHYRHLQL